MKKKLLSFQYKTITLDQLTSMAGRMEYSEFAGLITSLINKGLLDPVKSSGKNGRRPALPNKFRIQKPEEDYTQALEDIKLLHPSFNHSKYIKQPVMYVKYKKEIDTLSKFLWEHEDLLQTPMSINERSFQIWGIEKLIKEKSVIKTIFQFNDWDLSLLNYYETPEPFFEYNFPTAATSQMNILIIENKDTWFTLRKIMREDGLNHLFRDYHVLLYGEGKKIISRNNRLKEYDEIQQGSGRNSHGFEVYQELQQGRGSNNQRFKEYQKLQQGIRDNPLDSRERQQENLLHNQSLEEMDKPVQTSRNTYYYFGDLDYEGIDIYQTLTTDNPELGIHLCKELYSWMLIESQKYNLPITKAGQRKVDITMFLQQFSAQEQTKISNILQKGTYIPQEILNYPLLKGKMMEGLTT